MNNKATLILTYIAKNKKKEEFKYDQLFIDQSEYKINEGKPINIEFNDIESEMRIKIVNAEFIDYYINDKDCHYFKIIPGNNYWFLFPHRGYTRDILFPDDSKYNIEIIYDRGNNI